METRWKQRFESFEKARKRFRKVLEAFRKNPKNEIYQIALVQAFEFAYELAWKTLKDYLNYKGFDPRGPREVIKRSFSENIIKDGQTWIHMLEDRNLLAHNYDENKTLDAVKRISKKYAPAIDQAYDCLNKKLSS